MRTKRERTGGFSLAEIAIALFVLALGLLAVVSLFPAAVQFGSATMTRTTAVNLARSAEATVAYSGILRELETGAVPWTATGYLGYVYSYPDEGLTMTDPDNPTYSWNALIFKGGSGSYLAVPENLYFVQLRVYRNYPTRSIPVDLFEVFLTR